MMVGLVLRIEEEAFEVREVEEEVEGILKVGAGGVGG